MASRQYNFTPQKQLIDFLVKHVVKILPKHFTFFLWFLLDMKQRIIILLHMIIRGRRAVGNAARAQFFLANSLGSMHSREYLVHSSLPSLVSNGYLA